MHHLIRPRRSSALHALANRGNWTVDTNRETIAFHPWDGGALCCRTHGDYDDLDADEEVRYQPMLLGLDDS